MTRNPATNESLIYSEVFPGGRHYSMMLRAGNALRLTDIEGGANVAMMLVNPENTLEKYNMPDTLKGQHTFRLAAGNTLYSDMGRAMACIVEDTTGWHDTATGTCNRNLVAERWGDNRYQDERNNFYRNGRDSFLIELGKYGLGRRDLAANINFFTRIEVSDDGVLSWSATQSVAGDVVELRFEMDCIVLYHTCPHPMNPAVEYPARPIQIDVRSMAPATPDDYCRIFRPESGRAFENTQHYRQTGDNA